ncbi:hypothetical protein IJU97_02335 [bacterium]|nr:hypothetical protein [bacterium]
MDECKKKFETLFDDSLTVLIKKVIDNIIVKELDECESEKEIKEYCNSDAKYKHIRNSWWSRYFDLNKAEDVNKYIHSKIDAAKMTIKSRPPRVKLYKDSVGNEYAKFKDEVVPVAHHEKKVHKWRMEPKRLQD